MVFKALRTKKEPKEFIHLQEFEGKVQVFTCDLPNPQPMTATLEMMKELYPHLEYEDIEMVVFEYKEISIETL